nr:CBS domain-containing protein [Enterococcus sp. JM4C]
MKPSEEFLISFNRIEKWLRDELNNPSSMGFSEMVRRLARRKDLQVAANQDDLLQIAQLRNAIIHDKISEDFVIAEPNEWILQRIKQIETELTKPELVCPRFEKKVTGFDWELPLLEILKIVAEKRYSQFPLYRKGRFEGLITLRALGFWFAKRSQQGALHLEQLKAKDLIVSDGKETNYQFISATTHVFEVEALFRDKATLEAVLITKDGNPNGNLVGIIRPRDLYTNEKD